MKDPYNENYKTLEKLTKKKGNFKNLPHSWMGKINIIQCPYYSKQFTDSVQSKLRSCFSDPETVMLKFIWKRKRCQLDQASEATEAKVETSQYQISRSSTVNL